MMETKKGAGQNLSFHNSTNGKLAGRCEVRAKLNQGTEERDAGVNHYLGVSFLYIQSSINISFGHA